VNLSLTSAVQNASAPNPKPSTPIAAQNAPADQGRHRVPILGDSGCSVQGAGCRGWGPAADSAFCRSSTASSGFPSAIACAPSPIHALHSTEKRPCAAPTARARAKHPAPSWCLPRRPSFSPMLHNASPWSRKRSILPRSWIRRSF